MHKPFNANYIDFPLVALYETMKIKLEKWWYNELMSGCMGSSWRRHIKWGGILYS